MVDATHKRFSAADRSYFSIIKREIHQMVSLAGFEPKKVDKIDLIVAELTSNLHKYAVGGEMLAGIIEEEGNTYLELICIDNGPGMKDARKMMADGVSTKNTLGHGLGSVFRLSDEFDLFSQQNWGTVVLSRVYKDIDRKKEKTRVAVHPLVIAKPNEQTSGDGFYKKAIAGKVKFMLADGLGHGPEANFAVNAAVDAFKGCPFDSPSEIIRFIHPAVRKTRGLVATVAVLDTKLKQLKIAGVGNISSRLQGPVLSKTQLPYNGIIGHNIPRTMNDHVLDVRYFNKLILCSDGIRSRWETGKYQQINKHDLSIVAAAIYKDFARQTDDMSVVVINM